MDRKSYAVEVCGVMHTLKPWHAPNAHQRQFKWTAYRDGVPWRLFKTKGEWEAAAQLDFPQFGPQGPHYEAAIRAEMFSTHEGNVALARLDIAHRIRQAVRAWPQWSARERERIEAITAEVLDHCRNGNGNGFVRGWCDRNLKGLSNGQA